jgi:hypothetical protein
VETNCLNPKLLKGELYKNILPIAVSDGQHPGGTAQAAAPPPDEEIGGSMYGKILNTMFVLALLLASCAPAALPAPTPTPFPEKFEGKANLGDYMLSIECEGSGEPTIILERGMFESTWGWSITDMWRFKTIARTCFYIRARSLVEIKKPVTRTVIDQVQDLHELLQQTGVPGPISWSAMVRLLRT